MYIPISYRWYDNYILVLVWVVGQATINLKYDEIVFNNQISLLVMSRPLINLKRNGITEAIW